MSGRADGAGVGELLELRPRLVEAELEVQEVQDARVVGTVAHRGGLLGVAPERLVAQHRMAIVDRARSHGRGA